MVHAEDASIALPAVVTPSRLLELAKLAYASFFGPQGLVLLVTARPARVSGASFEN